jgi:hypothetical protein
MDLIMCPFVVSDYWRLQYRRHLHLLRVWVLDEVALDDLESDLERLWDKMTEPEHRAANREAAELVRLRRVAGCRDWVFFTGGDGDAGADEVSESDVQPPRPAGLQ